MARLIATGKIINDKYTFYNEKGEIIASLKSGDRYYIQNNCYYEIIKIDNKWYAQKWNKRERKYIRQPLYNDMKVCLATSSESAQKSLYTFYKKVKEEDRLVEVLRKVGFVVQCMNKVKTLEGIEIKIKPGYVKQCNNFSPDKNWYTYSFYTDSDSYDNIKVLPEACVNCNKKRQKLGRDICSNALPIQYIELHSGTYFIVIRENVKTEKKEIIQITAVESVDRNKLSCIIEDIFN